MRLQNKKVSNEKKRIAYFCSLALLFSYAEAFFPRVVPFFRLGFGNVAILLALDFSLKPFLILTLAKSIAASLASGTLFSPFIAVSVAQSFFSGLTMWSLARLCRGFFSVYGISMLGAAVSTCVQIFMASFIAGEGTMQLLAPMLIFSQIAAVITAFLATKISIPDELPKLPAAKEEKQSKLYQAGIPLAIILSSAFVLTIKKIPILVDAFIAALLLQRLSGRKIKILPHVFLWIFFLLSNVFVPEGKVLLKVAGLQITEGTIHIGFTKALAFSAIAALSQCASLIKVSTDSIFAQSMLYFENTVQVFKLSAKKNPIERLNEALAADSFLAECKPNMATKGKSLFIAIAMVVTFSTLFLVNNLY